MNLLKMNDILKNRVQISLSMQSLKTETLTDIKRKNWTKKEYIEFCKELSIPKKPARSEMIIPLPSETERSYFEVVKFLMDNNVMTSTYTLMMLCGAELGRNEAIKKYGMISKTEISGSEINKTFIFLLEICLNEVTLKFFIGLNKPL